MIPSEADIKRERDAARSLRKSPWWKAKIHNAPKCYYCNSSLAPEDVTMDHVLSLAQGGKSTKGNVVVSCKPCNTKKSATSNIEAIVVHSDFYSLPTDPL